MLFKRDFAHFRKALEDERLRLRAITHRGTYGTEYFRLISADFVKNYSNEALIQASAFLDDHGARDPQQAKAIVDTELGLRNSRATDRGHFYTKLGIAITVIGSAIAAYKSLVD